MFVSTLFADVQRALHTRSAYCTSKNAHTPMWRAVSASGSMPFDVHILRMSSCVNLCSMTHVGSNSSRNDLHFGSCQ